MRNITFEPRITFGNVLQLIVLSTGLLGIGAAHIETRVRAEARMSYVENQQVEMKNTLKSLAESQATVVRNIDRITMVLENQAKERKQ